jgi:hypothetical protein
VRIEARNSSLSALRQLFPQKPPDQPDRLQAVFEAVGTIDNDDTFVELCGGIEHLRNIVSHQALDRLNDLPPKQEAAVYRDLALAIETLGIIGDPPNVSEQMHDHLTAGIEKIWGADIDADLWLREWLERSVRGIPVLRAAASVVERELAAGDLQWIARTPVYPPGILENIEDVWARILSHRRAGMSVNRRKVNADRPRRSVAGGPFLRFAVACLELFDLPADYNAVRQAILRDRERRKGDSSR